MADIAAIFHWSLDRLETMDLVELGEWHARALDRYNLMNGIGKKSRKNG